MTTLQSIPTSGGDLLEGALAWLGENTAPHVARLVDQFNRMMFSVPAPGQPRDPQTWLNPTNGWWPTVYEFYQLFFGIAIAILCLAFLASFMTDDAAKSRKYQKGIARAFVYNVFGFVIAALLLHIGNGTSLAFAPSGAEFMTTPGNVARLGLGIPIGIVLLIYNAGAVLLGIFFVFVYYFSIHAIVAGLPLFITFKEMPQSNIRSVGEFGIATFITMVFIKVFQTVLLRLAFSIPWAEAGASEAVTGTLGIATAVAVAMVFVPVAGFYKLMPSAMMLVGGGAVLNKATNATRKGAREGAKRGYERIHTTTQEKEKDGRRIGSVTNNSGYTNDGHTKS